MSRKFLFIIDPRCYNLQIGTWAVQPICDHRSTKIQPEFKTETTKVDPVSTKIQPDFKLGKLGKLR